MELTQSVIISILSLIDSSIHSSKQNYIYVVSLKTLIGKTIEFMDKLTFSKELRSKCVSQFGEFLSDIFKTINHKYMLIAGKLD